MHALLGGLDPAYKKLHTKAMATAKKHLLFRPMLPPPPAEDLSPTPDILFPDTVLSNGRIVERAAPEIQHLGCFAGGMFALGGRLFGDEAHVHTGEQLARGCAWAYDAFPTGVMPESARLVPCDERKPFQNEKEGEGEGEDHHLAPCAWNETRWAAAVGERTAPRGFAALRDTQYQLRPEAIESIFILYRVTGKADLLDFAWRMFESICKATRTEHAYSAIGDVRVAGGRTAKLDSMEVSLLAYP
jgi:mannosyl-oligosaccharide alpha-1,2-mannosidase